VNPKNKRWLLIDIETSTSKGEFYGRLFEAKIVKMIEEAHLTGFAVKWYGDKKIYVYDLKDFNGSEKKMLEKILWWVEQADYFIAHNGDKFDLKFINARLDKFHMPTLPPIKTVDTLKIARRLWNLSSYKLDFLGWYFDIGRKSERPHVEDREMTDKERKQEKKYNSNDVLILEKLFNIQLPHIGYLPMFKIPKPKLSVSKDRTCPREECGSTHTNSRGRKVAGGKIWRQLICRDCFNWFYVEDKI
jgi:DNA polymerase III epsilon subunit-like protein